MLNKTCAAAAFLIGAAGCALIAGSPAQAGGGPKGPTVNVKKIENTETHNQDKSENASVDGYVDRDGDVHINKRG